VRRRRAVTRPLRFGRWPSEVRIALLLGLSVVLPCLLLALFGVRAHRTEQAEAEAAVRIDLDKALRQDVVEEVADTLDGALAAAARHVRDLPLTDPAASVAFQGLERSGGPFSAAYAVEPDGTVRDSSLKVVRGSERLVVPERRIDEARDGERDPDVYRRFAADWPLGVDESGWPITLGFLVERAVVLLDGSSPEAASAILDAEEVLRYSTKLVSASHLKYLGDRIQGLFEKAADDRSLTEGRTRIERKCRHLDAIDSVIRPSLRKHLAAGPGHEIQGDIVLLRAPVVEDDEEDAGFLLVLVLDRAALVRDVLDPALAKLDLPDGFRTARGDAAAVTDDRLAKESLARPLHDIRVAIFADDPEALENAARSSGGRYLVILVLAIVGAAAAAFVTLRTVSAEIRLAKRTSDFVSNVTHELKTPLTSIRMFVETLQDGRVKDDAERRECLDVIARETDRLQERIERVLKLARLGAGRTAFDLHIVDDIGSVLNDAAKTCRTRIADRPGAELTDEIEMNLGPARIDRRALEEAVANLLANAVKYSPRDRCRLKLKAWRTAQEIVVEVSDEGIGIPPGDRERVFERFYRVDDPVVREAEGTGLGLALVRRIVEAHGGHMSLDSTMGEGSQFRIHLPTATP
jgi:signal transduction histidine kinase